MRGYLSMLSFVNRCTIFIVYSTHLVCVISDRGGKAVEIEVFTTHREIIDIELSYLAYLVICAISRL